MRPEPDIGIDAAMQLVDRTRRAATLRRIVASAHYAFLALTVLIAAFNAVGCARHQPPGGDLWMAVAKQEAVR